MAIAKCCGFDKHTRTALQVLRVWQQRPGKVASTRASDASRECSWLFRRARAKRSPRTYVHCQRIGDILLRTRGAFRLNVRATRSSARSIIAHATAKEGPIAPPVTVSISDSGVLVRPQSKGRRRLSYLFVSVVNGLRAVT
jgi:hypothetical protein